MGPRGLGQAAERSIHRLADHLDVGGIDGVDLDATDLEPMALDRSDLDDSVWYLRRGVIGVRTIGYV